MHNEAVHAAEQESSASEWEFDTTDPDAFAAGREFLAACDDEVSTSVEVEPKVDVVSEQCYNLHIHDKNCT